jgi:uncharacterized coiled-coil DUF342 family protein
MLNKVNETFKIIYNSIDEMEATINEQRAEIKRLREQRDEAQVDQQLIEELWERRTDASEANAKIRQLLGDTEQLLKERDEARREVCRLIGGHIDENNNLIGNENDCALWRGWDCYKEESP